VPNVSMLHSCMRYHTILCVLFDIWIYTTNCQGRTQDFFQGRAIGGGRDHWLGGTIASAEYELTTGVWGQSPQRGPGQSPWSGSQGSEDPLKLKTFWSLDVQRSRQI